MGALWVSLHSKLGEEKENGLSEISGNTALHH